MSYVTTSHNGYSYSIAWDGAHFVAICDRSGRCKLRRDRNIWCNEITDERGAVVRHERITGQDILIAKLERGVCELQAILAITPKPVRNGTKPSRFRRERVQRPRRAMHPSPEGRVQ